MSKSEKMGVPTPKPNDVIFMLGGKEALRIKYDGDFLVSGKKVKKDIEVYTMMKAWLKGTMENVKIEQANHIVRILLERLNQEPEFRVLMDKYKDKINRIEHDLANTVKQILGVKETRGNHIREQ